MAIPNPNLTEDEAKWLVEFYAPKMNHGINNSTISWHQRAFNSIKGTNQPIPSCSCHWVSASRVAQSLYGQYETEIREIAYPVKKTKTRAKN